MALFMQQQLSMHSMQIQQLVVCAAADTPTQCNRQVESCKDGCLWWQIVITNVTNTNCNCTAIWMTNPSGMTPRSIPLADTSFANLPDRVPVATTATPLCSSLPLTAWTPATGQTPTLTSVRGRWAMPQAPQLQLASAMPTGMPSLGAAWMRMPWRASWPSAGRCVGRRRSAW